MNFSKLKHFALFLSLIGLIFGASSCGDSGSDSPEVPTGGTITYKLTSYKIDDVEQGGDDNFTVAITYTTNLTSGTMTVSGATGYELPDGFGNGNYSATTFGGVAFTSVSVTESTVMAEWTDTPEAARLAGTPTTYKYTFTKQ